MGLIIDDLVVPIMIRLIRLMIVAVLFIIVCGGVFPNVACAEDAIFGSQNEQHSYDTSGNLFNELQNYIDIKTEKVTRKYNLLPESAKDLFENEVCLIIINMDSSGTLKIKAVKDEVNLSEFVRIYNVGHVNPSIIIQANESTVRMLMNCESDRQSFEKGIEALIAGDVEVDFIGNNNLIAYLKNGAFWLIVGTADLKNGVFWTTLNSCF